MEVEGSFAEEGSFVEGSFVEEVVVLLRQTLQPLDLGQRSPVVVQPSGRVEGRQN